MRKVPLATLALAAVAAGAALWLGTRSSAPALSAEGPVWRLRSEGLLYRYHATFRIETLFDAARDPTELEDLSKRRPADLERLRREFLRRLGVADLAKVPDAGGAKWLEDLRRSNPGYVGGGGDGR